MAWKWENWLGAHRSFWEDRAGFLYDDEGGEPLKAFAPTAADPHIEVEDEGIARAIERVPELVDLIKILLEADVNNKHNRDDFIDAVDEVLIKARAIHADITLKAEC